jgi:dihydrofolate reductase
MSSVICQISVSLDGFAAGPNQSLDNPLGEGGERLHEWAFPTEAWLAQHGREGGERSADSQVAEEVMQGIGAFVMGRKMFGGGDGPWDTSWTGWWGARPAVPCPGLRADASRAGAAGDGGRDDLPLRHGRHRVRARAGPRGRRRQERLDRGRRQHGQPVPRGRPLDELYLHIAPVVLGAGERLLKDVGDLKLEPITVVPSPAATHVKYRIAR